MEALHLAEGEQSQKKIKKMCIRDRALITHLQKFLLELGRGFSFVARQKRITFDGRHFRIDLVSVSYTHLDVYKRQPMYVTE